ncbi:MAG: hypothetical protein AABX05_05580, partial [Nanoarchaeota archaeon]
EKPFPVPEGLSLSQPEYNVFSGLVYLSMGLYIFFSACKSYFKDQIMTPPKKKKKVLKALLEKAKGKVQPEPVPQLEPNKYSIDDVIGE